MEPRSFLETPIAPFTVPSIGYPNKSSPKLIHQAHDQPPPQKNLVHQNTDFFILVQDDPVIVQFNFSFSLQMLLLYLIPRFLNPTSPKVKPQGQGEARLSSFKKKSATLIYLYHKPKLL